MAAEELIQKILTDARTRAAAITARAEEQSAEIRSRYREALEALRTEFQERSRRETEALLERSRSQARLEMRKRLLAGRWSVIEKVIAQALKRFIQDPQYPKLLVRVVKKYAQPDSTVHLSPEDTRRFGSSLGFQPGEPVPISGGVIIRTGKMELNFSLDELGKLARQELASELSQTLFGQEPS